MVTADKHCSGWGTAAVCGCLGPNLAASHLPHDSGHCPQRGPFSGSQEGSLLTGHQLLQEAQCPGLGTSKAVGTVPPQDRRTLHMVNQAGGHLPHMPGLTSATCRMAVPLPHIPWGGQ